MKFLIMCGMSDPVEALAFKVWRDCVVSMIHSAQYKYADDEYVHDENLYLINRIRAKVALFEDELPKLKEITTILELALWKLRMNEIIPPEEATHRQTKIKTDEWSMRTMLNILWSRCCHPTHTAVSSDC